MRLGGVVAMGGIGTKGPAGVVVLGGASGSCRAVSLDVVVGLGGVVGGVLGAFALTSPEGHNN